MLRCFAQPSVMNGKMCAALERESETHRNPTLVSFGGRFPVLCADHRQAHLALLIDVGVINSCLKSDLRRFEGVLRRENYFNSERTFVIRRVVLQGRNKVLLEQWTNVCTIQNESSVQSRTYRHNEPLPWQHIWFVNKNVSEVFHSRSANLFKFLGTGGGEKKNQSWAQQRKIVAPFVFSSAPSQMQCYGYFTSAVTQTKHDVFQEVKHLCRI